MSCARSIFALLGSGAVCSAASGAFSSIEADVSEVWLPGVGPVHVVRLEASFSDPEDKLAFIFGVTTDPLVLRTSDGLPIYQHPLGGDSAPPVDAVADDCTRAYDTFLDIGQLVASDGPPVSFSGDDFPDWSPDGIASAEGGWLRQASDPLTTAGADGRVLFAQFVIPQHPHLLWLEGDIRFFAYEATGPVMHDESILVPLAEKIPLCAGDVNRDAAVNIDDLVAVITSWGDCVPCEPCSADTNGDGTVNVDDLVQVIVDWDLQECVR